MHKNYIEQIRAIIEITGWSQVRLAKELGVTFTALNRWLNKHAVPHPAKREEIYRLYKVHVGILPLSLEEIKEGLKSVDEERKKHVNIRKLLQENKNLREDLLLELTYNSNAIEGSTLTKNETEAIIFDHAQIPHKTYFEHLEATNHAVALERIFNGEFSGPITEVLIKDLHRTLLQGIRSDAGNYAQYHRAIRGIDLRLPAPEDIPDEMRSLTRYINHPKDHPIAHAAKMHADFEVIHPFGDGNGRVGRLIMIIQLIENNYAPCVIENKRKAEYYEVLEFAQKHSETHLIQFIASSVLRGYQLITKHRK